MLHIFYSDGFPYNFEVPPFSGPAFSTPVIWCRVFQFRVFQSRVFSDPDYFLSRRRSAMYLKFGVSSPLDVTTAYNAANNGLAF